MTEPVFIQQTREPDRDARWSWMMDAATEGANRHGCAFFRVSFDSSTMTVLIEGWMTKPDDCGPPRYEVR